MLKHGVFDLVEFKALPQDGEEKGRFEAIVSVFGNKDRQNERVMEGAFAKSLAQWRESKAPIPVIWSHDWGNPFAHIGRAEPTDVTEVKGRGLKVIGTIDIKANSFAAQVYHLMKNRTLKEFSFGYEIRRAREGKDGAKELLELDLIEVGPTLKGANDRTELLAIKSLEDAAKSQKTPPWHVEGDRAGCDGFAVVADETDEVVGCHDTREEAERHMAALYANVEDASKSEDFEVKAGRTISSKNEAKIRSAVEALTEVLASLGGADEKAEDDEADEAKVKADEPKATVDLGLLALQALILNAKE